MKRKKLFARDVSRRLFLQKNGIIAKDMCLMRASYEKACLNARGLLSPHFIRSVAEGRSVVGGGSLTRRFNVVSLRYVYVDFGA